MFYSKYPSYFDKRLARVVGGEERGTMSALRVKKKEEELSLSEKEPLTDQL